MVIFRYLILLIVLFLGGFVSINSWATPISEEKQFQLVQNYFADGLHYSAHEEARIYLKNFPDGLFHENILFIKIRSDELQSNDLAHLSKIVRDYHNYRLTYPNGEWLEESLFSEGILLVKLGNYKRGISLLEEFLTLFPKSHHQEMVFYRLGEAAFHSAEDARKNGSLRIATVFDKKTISALSKIPDSNQLSKEQLVNRFYFLGWTYHFQKDIQNAKKWLLAYINLSQDKTHIARAYYQLGQNEWRKKNYQKALSFFNKLNSFPEFPLRNSTLFLKAEAHYQIFRNNPPQKNKKEAVEKIVQSYQGYLDTQDPQYQSLTYYRLGEIHEEIKQDFNSAIAFYQNYLKTKEDQYRNSSQTRIAAMYYQLGQQEWKKQNYPQALNFFNKLDPFPTFPLRNPTLFLKAEAHYQIFLKNPPQENKKKELVEKIIKRYQNYLTTGDKQYQEEAHNRIATIYYELGQDELNEQNYKQALTFFDQLAPFSRFPLRNSVFFFKAETHYQIFLQRPPGKNKKEVIEKIVKQYQNYLKTKDEQYLSNTYYRLGELYTELDQSQKAISYYQQYLKHGNSPNQAEVHYNLGQIFVKNKNYQKAIDTLQLARKSEHYRNNSQVIEQLAWLFKTTNQNDALQKLWNEAKNNKELDQKERNYFQLQDINFALQTNRCDKILKELNTLPTGIDEENRHYLIYARGKCLIETQQWQKAETDLINLKNDPQYETQVFDLLLIAYQASKNWHKLAQHIEHYLPQKTFSPQSAHFQTLLSAYHQMQDWQKVSATYTRWESVFPKEIGHPDLLLDWAKAEESLGHPEKSRVLYERTLAISELDLISREGIVSHLAETYQKDSDYLGITKLYEQHLIPHLTNPEQQQKYAFALGEIYHNPLQQFENAKKWLQRVDQGGVTDLEIQAGLLLSAIEEEEGKTQAAIQRLNQLAQRPLQKTLWNLHVNYQAARLYESLGQFKQAAEKYQVAALHAPVEKADEKTLQNHAKQKIQEIEKNSSEQELDQLIKNKSWKQVAQKIRSGLTEKLFLPTNELYETWVYAEVQQKNWKGILNAYQTWGTLEPAKVQSLEALLTQGQAAHQLSDRKLTQTFYNKAFQVVPVKDLQTRIFLTDSLGLLYEQEKNYKKVVEMYEKTYPFLKKSKDQIRFAYTIGSYYVTHLKQNKKAQQWFLKADKGGTSEEELSAAWQLAELETQASKAVKRLAKIATRPIKKKLKWYISINFQLGKHYHRQEQWQKAKLHYDRVAKTKPSNQYKAEQQFAKQQSAEITTYLKQLKATQ